MDRASDGTRETFQRWNVDTYLEFWKRESVLRSKTWPICGGFYGNNVFLCLSYNPSHWSTCYRAPLMKFAERTTGIPCSEKLEEKDYGWLRVFWHLMLQNCTMIYGMLQSRSSPGNGRTVHGKKTGFLYRSICPSGLPQFHHASIVY